MSEMREDGSYTKEEFQARKAGIESEIEASQIALKASTLTILIWGVS